MEDLSQPTRESGERRKLTQWSPGRSPGQKPVLVHLSLSDMAKIGVKRRIYSARECCAKTDFGVK